MHPRIACLLLPLLSLAAETPAYGELKKDLAALQGTWQLVSVEAEGKPRELASKTLQWAIKGNKILYAGDDLAGLTVDSSTTPWSLDVEFRNPKKVYEGICSVDGDTLEFCINRLTEGIKERPNAFATQDKPDWRLLVFQRVKPGEELARENFPGFVGIAIKSNENPPQVVISDVIAGSPAQKAGLKKDDIVLKVGAGEAIDLRTVVGMCRQAKPGSTLTLRIKREGKEQDISVKVGVLPFFELE